jgi:hypothetical protein
MRDVVTALRLLDPNVNEEEDCRWAITLANSLEDQRSAPHVHLLWAPGYRDMVSAARARLLIITMAGLPLPQAGSDETTWTEEQRVAVPLMHVAAYLTTRRIYDAPMSAPKMAILDEAHWLGEWGSGRALLQLLRRDSRKRRARVLVPTQNPTDVLAQAAGVDNLITEVFVGRIESPQEADDALGLLDVERSPAHRTILARLSAPVNGQAPDHREFAFHDGISTEVIRLVIPDPTLKAALNPEADSFRKFLPEQRGADGHLVAG